MQQQQPNPMQIAEVEEKKAGTAERMAKAKKTNIEADGQAMELAAMQQLMQPQGNLPPAIPQGPTVQGAMPPIQ